MVWKQRDAVDCGVFGSSEHMLLVSFQNMVECVKTLSRNVLPEGCRNYEVPAMPSNLISIVLCYSY